MSQLRSVNAASESDRDAGLRGYGHRATFELQTIRLL